jgi:hypothetical protein
VTNPVTLPSFYSTVWYSSPPWLYVILPHFSHDRSNWSPSFFSRSSKQQIYNCVQTQILSAKQRNKVKVTSYYRPWRPLRESRGIALSFPVKLGTVDGGGWSTPRPGRLYHGKDPVPIIQDAGWVSEPVWIGAENFASTAIRSPDLPARSESLYRLSHPEMKFEFLLDLFRSFEKNSALVLSDVSFSSNHISLRKQQ